MSDRTEVLGIEVAEAIDVFHGDMSDATAKIYVRAEGERFRKATLSAVVSGPSCEFSHTLTFDTPLVSLGEGESLLAAANLPDPCPWTPELPMLYDVSYQVTAADGQMLAEGRRTLGLRPLGGRGGDLFLSGRRWVIRGAAATSLASTQQADVESLDDWRDAHAAMLVDDPSDGLCAAASRRGVLLIAAIATGEDLTGRLRQLARWPAVAMVALAGDAKFDKAVRQAVPNLLFAERRTADGQSHAVADWADLLVYEGEAADIGSMTPDRELPILAVRSRPQAFEDIVAARAACDLLQRDLAPHGQFAGYLV